MRSVFSSANYILCIIAILCPFWVIGACAQQVLNPEEGAGLISPVDGESSVTKTIDQRSDVTLAPIVPISDATPLGPTSDEMRTPVPVTDVVPLPPPINPSTDIDDSLIDAGEVPGDDIVNNNPEPDGDIEPIPDSQPAPSDEPDDDSPSDPLPACDERHCEVSSSDNCCPNGCTIDNDSDCLPSTPERAPVLLDKKVDVISLTYIPTVTCSGKMCVDYTELGGINKYAHLFSSDATMVDPLSEIRARVRRLEEATTAGRRDATRFGGYDNANIAPAIDYNILEKIEYLKAIPPSANFKSGGETPFPDYLAILSAIDICDYVDRQGIQEVWIWSYHTDAIEPVESNMSMGTLSRAVWNRGDYGDISNSYWHNDLPQCERTYTVYNYSYERTEAEALHNHGHHIERVFGLANHHLFWNVFSGEESYAVGATDRPRRCGNTHFPPNANDHYQYGEPATVMSDCDNWQPIDCSDRKRSDKCGSPKPIGCSRWNCDQFQFLKWWMQHIPGPGNNYVYNGHPLRNWWELIDDFDAAVQGGKYCLYNDC